MKTFSLFLITFYTDIDCLVYGVYNHFQQYFNDIEDEHHGQYLVPFDEMLKYLGTQNSTGSSESKSGKNDL